MSCILCFLSDEFQSRLRNQTSTRSEVFEEIIVEYATEFVWELEHLNSIESCDIHSKLNNVTVSWANELYNTIEGLKNIKDIFKNIYEVYQLWIEGSSSKSYQSLCNIFDEYKLLDHKENLDKYFLFRGRSSKNKLNIKDLFHIPFNKRYLISNQRYSISGQPCLYLGFSIIDIIFELGKKISDLSDIWFSSFFLKHDETLLTFNFTNQFPLYISTIDIINEPIEFNEKEIYPNKDNCISLFIIFILASICSFKRNLKIDQQYFYEEYVIPQMVTELLRDNKYDGVIYTSNSFNNQEIKNKTSYYLNTYKQNAVLFTSPSVYDNYNNDYDYQLLDKFFISNPLTISDVFPTTINDIKLVGEQIHDIHSKMKIFNSLRRLGEFTMVNFELYFDNIYIKDIDGKEHKYLELPCGQIHLFMLKQFLKTFRNFQSGAAD